LNVDGIKRGGAVGHDLPFLFRLGETLAELDLDGKFKVHSPAYPYGTVAEILYFHLRGTKRSTQELTLDLLGLPQPTPSYAKTISPFTQLAASLKYPREKFLTMYDILVSEEPALRNTSFRAHLKPKIESLEDFVSLDSGVRFIGQSFLNFEYESRRKNNIRLETDYVSRLPDLDSISPSYGINTGMLLEMIEKRFRGASKFRRRMADRVWHLSKVLKNGNPAAFAPDRTLEEHLARLWDKETKRFGRVSYLFEDFNCEDLLKGTPKYPANYDECVNFAEEKILIYPVRTLKVLKSLARHPLVLTLPENSPTKYLTGAEVLRGSFRYARKTGTVVLNQFYSTRPNEAMMIMEQEKVSDLPIINFPSVNEYSSTNDSFVFGLRDLPS